MPSRCLEREDRLSRFRISNPKGKIAIRPFGKPFLHFGLAIRTRRLRSVISESNSCVSDWQPEIEDRDPSFRKAILTFRIGNPKSKITICPFGKRFLRFGLAIRNRRSRSVLSESDSYVSDSQPELEDRNPSFRKTNLTFRVGNPKSKIAIRRFGCDPPACF